MMMMMMASTDQSFNASAPSSVVSDEESTDDAVDCSSIKKQDSKVEMEFSEDEETLISRMFSLVGKRWGLIAGRIPGRTAEEIEKYWTTSKQSYCSTTTTKQAMD